MIQWARHITRNAAIYFIAVAVAITIQPARIAAQDTIYEGEWPPELEGALEEALEEMPQEGADNFPEDDSTYDDERQPGIQWITGPGAGEIGPWAIVEVPPEYRFTGEEDAYDALEASSAPKPDFQLHFEYGYIEPIEPNADWHILFTFDDYGYLRREGDVPLHTDRIRRFYETEFFFKNEFMLEEEKLRFVGWKISPRFTPDGGAEWAATIRNGTAGMLVNYVRALPGRAGCLQLVSNLNAADFDRRLPQIRAIAARIQYKPGQAYADFESSDAVAYITLNEYLENDIWTDERGGLNTLFAWFEKLVTNAQVEWELRSSGNDYSSEDSAPDANPESDSPSNDEGFSTDSDASTFPYWYLAFIPIGVAILLWFDARRKRGGPQRYGPQ
ncbi:MAG: DUF2167 domain-containing protein [bacterium]|nr:DUF2167 domain-containing protein [bacterium]